MTRVLCRSEPIAMWPVALHLRFKLLCTVKGGCLQTKKEQLWYKRIWWDDEGGAPHKQKASSHNPTRHARSTSNHPILVRSSFVVAPSVPLGASGQTGGNPPSFQVSSQNPTRFTKSASTRSPYGCRSSASLFVSRSSWLRPPLSLSDWNLQLSCECVLRGNLAGPFVCSSKFRHRHRHKSKPYAKLSFYSPSGVIRDKIGWRSIFSSCHPALVR